MTKCYTIPILNPVLCLQKVVKNTCTFHLIIQYISLIYNTVRAIISLQYMLNLSM